MEEIWIAVIRCFITITVCGLLLAGMYDSLRMRIKYLEDKLLR